LKSRGLSQTNVRQIRAFLHRACRLARKWSSGQLRNPVADAELPAWSISERPPDVRAPSSEEVRALLDAAFAYDVRIGVFLQVVAATGARRGEVCALRWSDVDQESAALRIDESVVAAGGGAIVKSPKTRASIRLVALDVQTLEALRDLRTQAENLAHESNVAIAEDGFVFSIEPDGALPPHPDAMTHAFSRTRKQAGLDADLHLHSLRHFHATALDPVVSERQTQARLGWSTVQMSRHYTDAIGAEDRRAAEHVGRLLAGAR
jgi:integrase